MANIIDAITNLVRNPVVMLIENKRYNNRANNMGKALEEYVKDIFAGTMYERDNARREVRLNEVFSYIGNENNPPDSMLRNGDAIEVKKLEGFGEIQLNSSHPKRFMVQSNSKINSECRNCPDWPINGTRDMLYIFGVCKNQCVKHLCMVYGTELCDDIEKYSRIENIISEALENAEDINNAESAELGRVNEVDELGISSLRIRGMWILENPFKVFNDIYTVDPKDDFDMMALISKRKYMTLSNKKDLENLALINENLNIKDVQVKDPTNKNNLIDCKLITFRIRESEE